jgi:hypothetical protein
LPSSAGWSAGWRHNRSGPELWVHRLRAACEIAEAALRVAECDQWLEAIARY